MYLVFARGGFWKVSGERFLPEPHGESNERVAVVIPARNEASTISQAVRSVLNQDYPGSIHVVVVDDHSSDETSSMALQAAVNLGKGELISVLSSGSLPNGWTGKLWAVEQGVQQAASQQPEYIWLTDADVVHGPDTLRKLTGKAREGFDLVSLMVKLRCRTSAERLFIPAFVFFFFKLYPPRWIETRSRSTAGAAGGCMLLRSDALRRIGGIRKIRNALIDDCALAREVKRSGGSIWLGLAEDSRSLRGYEHWADVWQMISRTAFTQLHHSTALLVGTLLGLFLTYLAPPMVMLAGGKAMAAGLVSWALMIAAYSRLVRYYGRSLPESALLPFIALFYAGATAYSAGRYWAGKGGEWKGRVQDPIRG